MSEVIEKGYDVRSAGVSVRGQGRRGWGGVRERGSGRNDETLKKFYFIECDFGISGCRLDDFERNMFLHSRVGRVQ